MRIAVINQPLGNRGDEAAHKAFVTELSRRLPDAEIDVIFLNSPPRQVDGIQRQMSCFANLHYLNLGTVPRGTRIWAMVCLRSRIPRLACLHPTFAAYLGRIRSYDRVVCAPGGICMGGFMDWAHVWQLDVARRLGIRTFYWGRSIGPFTDEDAAHARFRELSHDLIRSFDYISLRDRVSYDLACQLRSDCRLVTDSAFLVNPEVSLPPQVERLTAGSDYIVYVPNELRWHYRYASVDAARIDELNIALMRQVREVFPEHTILMLPQTYGSNVDDHGYFEHLRNLSDMDGVLVMDESSSSDEQQTIIRRASLVLGARYHSVVFAINNGVPFVSLSYEHKMRGLLAELGLSDCELDLETAVLGEGDCSEFAALAADKMRNARPRLEERKRAKTMVRDGFDDMVASMA